MHLRRLIPLHPPFPGPAVVAVLLAVVVGNAACGGDADRRSADQPTPQGTAFDVGLFDDIPRYSRSEPLGERTDKEGATSQSFKATGATPAQILDFYAGRLAKDGWETIEPVRQLGPGTVRGKWAQPAWLLTVSASAAPTVTAPGSAIEEYSQYSLSLEPATVDPMLDGTDPSSGVPTVQTVGDFADRSFTVTPVRDYDPVPDETAFSWQLQGEGPADYVLVVSCGEATVVTAAGPAGAPIEGRPIVDDATGLTGLKWQPGSLGSYTVEYEGAVSAAELVVKNGAGSRRVRAGTVPCATAAR